MTETILYIIITISVFFFLLDRILDYLNLKNLKPELPKQLEGIYDKEKYKKSQEYEKESSRFALYSSSFSFVLTLAMLIFGGFGIFYDWITTFADNLIYQTLIFFGLLMLASDILGLPFSYYSTFVIEEKYGFNKMNLKTFIFDTLKGWLVAGVMGGIVISAIVWFYMLTQENFWLYAWLLVTGFSVFMMMFYSSIIVPLFNKQTPLEEGELRTKIEDFSQKVGFKLNNIFVIDGSKRSTKANAYFSGLGPKKRIVLYDTLINDLDNDELLAVLAHEVGHYKKKHTLQSLFISVIQTGVTLYILSLMISIPELSYALGSETQSFALGLMAFSILFSPINTILGLFMNVLSRKNEYEADNFAKAYNFANALISGLKKLSVKNLSNLTPHKAVVFMHYSHPTLLQRIKNLKT